MIGLKCESGNITDCNDSLMMYQNSSDGQIPVGCEKMLIFAENENKDLLLPSPKLSTDNAAMICIAAKNNLITNDLGLEDIRLSSIIS